MYVTCSSVCKISDRFSFNLFSSFISVSNLLWAVHVFLYQDNSNPMLQLHWVDPFQWRANFAAAWISSILCLYCLTLCSLISIVGVMIMQEIGWQRHFVSLVCGSEFSFLKCLSMATWDYLISSLTFWCTFLPNLRLFQHHVGLSRWALKNSIFFCSSDEFSRGMKELLTSSCNL